MLKFKELIKQVAFEALISGVKRIVLWKTLYTPPNRNLFKVK